MVQSMELDIVPIYSPRRPDTTLSTHFAMIVVNCLSVVVSALPIRL